MSYKVVKASSSWELEGLVKDQLKLGWVPHGSVSVSLNPMREQWAQAMVNKDWLRSQINTEGE